MFVNRQGTGSAAGRDNYNRAYGVDANVQVSSNAKLFAFIARSDSPGATASDYAGRAYYSFANNLWQAGGGFSQDGDPFNAEVGFVPRRGFPRPKYRNFLTPLHKPGAWFRRVSSRTNAA